MKRNYLSKVFMILLVLGLLSRGSTVFAANSYSYGNMGSMMGNYQRSDDNGYYGYGHMGGMMGGMMYSFFNNDTFEESVSIEDALTLANVYLETTNEDLSAESEGHDFYGYYTFHVSTEGDVVGMISVNSYTGSVWYHEWHGELLQVVSSHHEQGFISNTIAL